MDYIEELRPWFECSDELLNEAYNVAVSLFYENDTADLMSFIHGYIAAIEHHANSTK